MGLKINVIQIQNNMAKIEIKVPNFDNKLIDFPLSKNKNSKYSLTKKSIEILKDIYPENLKNKVLESKV